MEDLIQEIQDRTGLSAEKVLEVVTIVTDYMKNALPADLIDQITDYLGAAANSPSDTATDMMSSATEIAAKAATVAASTFTSVVGAAVEMIPTPDDK
ncbi:MAG: hypothetical protein ABFR53_13165 [Actinomycetota bacterium]